MTLKKQLLNIVPLVLLLCGLFAYNFMDAQWSGPAATPPEQNATAPINIGGIYQAKLGDLGAIRMRAGAYCNADGTVCVNGDEIGGGGGGSTGGFANGNMQFVGYYTSPDITVNVPSGANRLIITPSASAACPLPGDVGSGVGLIFKADFVTYARLRSDAGNNNGGYTSISGAANGVVNVAGKSSVNLIVVKETYNSNYTRRAEGTWNMPVACPQGSAMDATFYGYTIYAVNTSAQSSSVNNTSPLTYAWYSGTWGSCAPTSMFNTCSSVGTQSRTVTCRRSDGVTMADSFCTGPKPTTSQSCTRSPTGDC